MTDRVVIETKGTMLVHDKRWFLELQKYILDGYRIAENMGSSDGCGRNYLGFIGRVVLYKEGKEPVELIEKYPLPDDKYVPQVKKEAEKVDKLQEARDKLADMKTKKPMLELAKEFNIEVPEGMRLATEVKKHLQDKL